MWGILMGLWCDMRALFGGLDGTLRTIKRHGHEGRLAGGRRAGAETGSI